MLQWLEDRLERERDQLPLWVPAALLAGIAWWLAFPDRLAWIGWMAGCLGLACGGLARPGSRVGKGAWVIGLAGAAGCALIWWRAEAVAAPVLDRPGLVEMTGVVERVQPMAAEATIRLLVRPETLIRSRARQPATGPLPARLRVNVDADKARDVKAGSRIRVRAWMMPPPPAAVPGGYDFTRTAWFQQIGGTGRALDLALVDPGRISSLEAGLSDLRNRLAAHVRASIEDDGAGGIAAALATGDQYGIPEEDIEAMRKSGLAHLLSVSGLHLTAVVGAVMLLVLRLLALSPTLALRFRLVVIAAGAGAAAGVAYTLLTGAEVPTVRAMVAALLVLLGLAIGRDALTLRLVATGALVVLLLWPESAAGASFQLSFAAIIAIVALHEHPRARALLARRDEAFPARMGRVLLALVLTGLAVELALTPIALFHFHRAGLYGAAANIVAIPLTTFVIMPLEALALLFDLVGLGAPFWWMTGLVLQFLLSLAHFTANAPGAVYMIPTIPVGAFALMVAGGLWICLWRTSWRRLGWIAVAAGGAWGILSSGAPDLLVTSDGRHVAVRTDAGSMAILRPRAGDYVQRVLGEAAGTEAGFAELEGQPFAACTADLCAANIRRDGKSWRLLVTRSREFVTWKDMVRACSEADIVVADRRLPRYCRPRWFRADPDLLRRVGGLAVHLEGSGQVRISRTEGDHPWARPIARR